MAWIYLFLAGCCEVAGVTLINQFHQKRKLYILLLLAGFFALSFFLLSLSMESIPMGTAYAVWTGIGASGGAIVGILFFGEQKDWKRIMFIAVILAAAIGLKLVD